MIHASYLIITSAASVAKSFTAVWLLVIAICKESNPKLPSCSPTYLISASTTAYTATLSILVLLWEEETENWLEKDVIQHWARVLT